MITILSVSVAIAAEEYYIVNKNDCLWKIALRKKVDIKALYGLNKRIIGKNPNLILPGQKLLLPISNLAYKKSAQSDIKSAMPVGPDKPVLELNLEKEKSTDRLLDFFISNFKEVKGKIVRKLDGIKITRSLIKANAAIALFLFLWFIFTKFKYRTVPEPGYYIDNEMVFIGTFKRNDVVSLCLLNRELFLIMNYSELIKWIKENLGKEFEKRISFELPVNIRELFEQWQISSHMIFLFNKLEQKKLISEIKQSDKNFRLAM